MWGVCTSSSQSEPMSKIFKDIFIHSPSQNGPTSSQTELMTPSPSPQLGSSLHWVHGAAPVW